VRAKTALTIKIKKPSAIARLYECWLDSQYSNKKQRKQRKQRERRERKTKMNTWNETQLAILDRVANDVYTVNYKNAELDGENVEGVNKMTPSETVLFLHSGDNYAHLDDGQYQILFGDDADDTDDTDDNNTLHLITFLSHDDDDSAISTISVEERITLDYGDNIPFVFDPQGSLESLLSWVTANIGQLSYRPYQFSVGGFAGVLTIGDTHPRGDGDLIINNSLCYSGKFFSTFVEVANTTSWDKIDYVMHVMRKVTNEGYSRGVQLVFSLYREESNIINRDLEDDFAWLKKVEGTRFPSFYLV
jgi:hypothetical protein